MERVAGQGDSAGSPHGDCPVAGAGPAAAGSRRPLLKLPRYHPGDRPY